MYMGFGTMIPPTTTKLSALHPIPTKIYSVMNDSWKKIDNYGGMSFSHDCPGKFVKGKLLHWIGVKWKPHAPNTVVVSLCLVEGEEEYLVVASSSYFSNYVHNSETRLEILGGYLRVIGSCIGGNGMRDMHIWVMTKYGAVESWTKIWALSDFDYHYTRRLFDCVVNHRIRHFG